MDDWTHCSDDMPDDNSMECFVWSAEQGLSIAYYDMDRWWSLMEGESIIYGVTHWQEVAWPLPPRTNISKEFARG